MKETEKKHFDYITLLKCVAILMITNSHSKWMYPDAISFLACGGAWGCAIFFFCSGFTMANIKTDCFWKYALKRLVRIYPVIWLWYLLTFSVQDDFTWTYMLWPKHWFIRAILLFYVLFYFVVKWLKKYIPMLVAACLGITLFIYFNANHASWMIDLTYQENLITWYYYFGLMLMGAYLRYNFDTSTSLNKQMSLSRFSYFVVPLSFLACYGIKFLCLKGYVLSDIQLLFPLLLYISCFIFYKVLVLLSWKKETKIVNVITFVAERTLEIYIVQVFILSACEKMGKPVGPVIAVLAIFACATFFHWFVSLLIKKSNIARFYVDK